MGTSLNSLMPMRHCISQSSLSLQNLVQLLSTQKGDKGGFPAHGGTPPLPTLRWAGWLLALAGFFLQATQASYINAVTFTCVLPAPAFANLD